MKKTDLMLGDFVKAKAPTEENIKIAEIYQTGIISEDGGAYLYDEILPIPLTFEILKKNGFGYIEKDEAFMLTHYYLGSSRYCKDMDLHIGTNNLGDYWINDRRNSLYGLRYVHELQHSLRMFGVEKEIVL